MPLQLPVVDTVISCGDEDEEEKRRSFSIPALEALKADSRALEMLREHYERLGLQGHMAQLEERLRNM